LLKIENKVPALSKIGRKITHKAELIYRMFNRRLIEAVAQNKIDEDRIEDFCDE